MLTKLRKQLNLDSPGSLTRFGCFLVAIVFTTLIAVPACTFAFAVGAMPRTAAKVAMPTATEAGRAAGAATLDFGVRMFRDLAAEHEGKNFAFSPMSAHILLHLAHTGARGTTQSEIARVLWPPQAKPADRELQSREMLATLNGRADSSLSISSSAWCDDRLSLNAQYQKDAMDIFGAETLLRPLSSPATSGEINQWISEATNGRITGMVEPMSADARLLLVSAFAFKGEWHSKFDRRQTSRRPFTLLDGTKVDVDMMKTEIPCQAVQSDGVIAVEIPFHQHGFSFIAVMAESGHSLDPVIKRLVAARFDKAAPAETNAPESLAKLIQDFGSIHVSKIPLSLPRFTMRISLNLDEPLRRLGMSSAFAPNADFSGMVAADSSTREPLFITSVAQQVFVEVNEEGAEAAGASSVTMGCSARIPDGTPIAFDRPFLYAIRDNLTGAVVVMGQVVDPR